MCILNDIVSGKVKHIVIHISEVVLSHIIWIFLFRIISVFSFFYSVALNDMLNKNSGNCSWIFFWFLKFLFFFCIKSNETKYIWHRRYYVLFTRCCCVFNPLSLLRAGNNSWIKIDFFRLLRRFWFQMCLAKRTHKPTTESKPTIFFSFRFENFAWAKQISLE